MYRGRRYTCQRGRHAWSHRGHGFVTTGPHRASRGGGGDTTKRRSSWTDGYTPSLGITGLPGSIPVHLRHGVSAPSRQFRNEALTREFVPGRSWTFVPVRGVLVSVIVSTERRDGVQADRPEGGQGMPPAPRASASSTRRWARGWSSTAGHAAARPVSKPAGGRGTGACPRPELIHQSSFLVGR